MSLIMQEGLGGSGSASAANRPLRNPLEQRARLPYPEAAPVPTQEGPEGIRFDFNEGARVRIPAVQAGIGKNPKWKITLRDRSTHNAVYSCEFGALGGEARSTKAYFVPWRIEVERDGKLVFEHDMELRNRRVLVQFATGTLGDSIAWFSYVPRFQAKHQPVLDVAIAPPLAELFEPAYGACIAFTTHEKTDPNLYYATYKLGLFFNDIEFHYAPVSFQLVGLAQIAAYCLGVDPDPLEPPKIELPEAAMFRPHKAPFAAIAVQSTGGAKFWQNPQGWHEVIRHLKEVEGLDAVCIDRERVGGQKLHWNHIPHGVIDQTGDRPLIERVNWLRHSSVFVGLSSGLAWLAWAAGARVVMISGFTLPMNEFRTQGRVINYHACNGCWNDPAHRFDHNDFLWCPRHKGTDRQFECTRLITSRQVCDAISAALAW